MKRHRHYSAQRLLSVLLLFLLIGCAICESEDDTEQESSNSTVYAQPTTSAPKSKRQHSRKGRGTARRRLEFDTADSIIEEDLSKLGFNTSKPFSKAGVDKSVIDISDLNALDALMDSSLVPDTIDEPQPAPSDGVPTAESRLRDEAPSESEPAPVVQDSVDCTPKGIVHGLNEQALLPEEDSDRSMHVFVEKPSYIAEGLVCVPLISTKTETRIVEPSSPAVAPTDPEQDVPFPTGGSENSTEDIPDQSPPPYSMFGDDDSFVPNSVPTNVKTGGTPPPPSSESASGRSKSGKLGRSEAVSSGAIIGIVAACVVVLVAMFFALRYVRISSATRGKDIVLDGNTSGPGLNTVEFSLMATPNLSPSEPSVSHSIVSVTSDGGIFDPNAVAWA